MFKKKNLKEGQKRWNVRKERRKNLIDHRLNYRIDHTFHLFLNIRSSNYQITHSGTPFHFYCIKYPCCEQRQKLHRKIKTFHYQEVPVFVYMVGSNWKKKICGVKVEGQDFLGRAIASLVCLRGVFKPVTAHRTLLISFGVWQFFQHTVFLDQCC